MMEQRQDLLSRNLELALEVALEAIESPETADTLAELGRGGALLFTDPNDTDMSIANRHLALRLAEQAVPVVPVHVERRRLTVHRG
jgi:hypothetical protein